MQPSPPKPRAIHTPLTLCLLAVAVMGLAGAAKAQTELGPIDFVAGGLNAGGGDVGQYAAFGHDPDGGQHIAYYDATEGDLKYAYRPDLTTDWTIEVIDSSGDAGRFASLAIQPLQTAGGQYRPVVSYQDSSTSRALGVARMQADGTWLVELVDGADVSGATFTGFESDVSVDSTGGIHVAYQDRTTTGGGFGRLQYARNFGTGWTLDPPDDTPERGFSASIATTNDDRAVILHYDTNEGLFDAVQFTSGTLQWTNSNVDPTSDTGRAIDLAYAEGQDRAVAVYRSEPTSAGLATLFLADGQPTSTSVSWSTQAILSGTQWGEFNALAVGATTDSARLAFYDGANRNLLFTEYNPGLPGFNAPFNLAVSPDAGRWPSADNHPLNGDFFCAFYDGAAQALKLARTDGATTSVETVDGFKAGRFSAIGETTTEVILAYHNDTDGTLRVTRWPLGTGPDDALATDELVDASSSDVGEYVSMTIQGDDIFLVYYDRARSNLRMAYSLAGAPWTSQQLLGESGAETVDQHQVGEYCRIAMGSVGGTTHTTVVAYQAGLTTTTLLPAVKTLKILEWDTYPPVDPAQAELLDVVTGEETGRFASIAYGLSGTRHISYFNDATLSPQYLRIESTDIATIETIESGFPFLASGWFTSIAVDPLTNEPAVAYYDITLGLLKFAQRIGANDWEVQFADTDLDTGLYPHLVFDESNSVIAIVYYNETNGQLRIAVRGFADAEWPEPTVLAEETRGVRPAVFQRQDGSLLISFYQQSSGDLLVSQTTDSPEVPPVVNAVKGPFFRHYR